MFYSVLQYAVDLEELPANPMDRVKAWKPPRLREVVDRRVVVNPDQARELLTAVTYVGQLDRGRHLQAFFACLYFAALRPAEALGLRRQDCQLPTSGWGLLRLAKSKPQTNRRWTDSGTAYDDRGLKHRAQDDSRDVPIPPELVRILAEHLVEFGVAADGRLFGHVAEASSPSAPTARLGGRPGFWPSHPIRSLRRLRAGRTIFGTRRSHCG